MNTQKEPAILAFHICNFGDPGIFKMQLGRIIYFEWSDMFGPLLVGKIGGPIDKDPTHRFLVAVTQWHRQGKRVCPDGFCVWRPEHEELVMPLGGRHYRATGLYVFQQDRCCHLWGPFNA